MVEVSRKILASPAAIFSVYRAVEHWHRWDPDTKSASLADGFSIGSQGFLTPSKGKTIPILLTEIETNHKFTVESRIPLLRMVFEHELTPCDAENATQVTHRVHFHGFLSPIFGWLLGNQLQKNLPLTLERLEQYILAQHQFSAS